MSAEPPAPLTRVARLLGITGPQLHEMAAHVIETGAAAYWQALDEAIRKALHENRVWDGQPETLEAAQEFIAGQIGIEATGDGTLRIMLFGQHAATVQPPRGVAVPRPVDETRLIQ